MQTPTAEVESHQKQTAVLQLINAHRFNGHRQSDLDPLKQYQRPDIPELDPAFHGLTDEDMDKTFNTGSLFAADEITLREIIHIIKTTYCGSIGAEYMHINETEQKRWIQKRLEEPLATPNFDKEQRIRILDRVIDANALRRIFTYQICWPKTILSGRWRIAYPLLDEIIQSGGAQDVKEMVIGMAHRGRLNVLVNAIGKKPSELFDEFEGKTLESIKGSGDVKYHMGYSSDISTPGGSVHLDTFI